MDAKFETLVEDSLREFPNESIYAMYERYLNGENELCDVILDKLKNHLIDIFRAPCPGGVVF
jgi:hypothetical protein